MILLRRLSTHRHVVAGAERFERNRLTGGLTVWWPDGVIGDYLPDQIEVVDHRRSRDGVA